MQIRLLGHLEATVDDRPVALGGAKQRAVLAMLGLEAGRPVSADRLIEGLWGEEPPPSAAKMLQHYVWRLRQQLADDDSAMIVTRGRAYELRLDREAVDACRLERLVAQASRAGEPNGAAREALSLFHGEPLADVAQEPFAAVEIRRLEELRLTAAELAVEADLAAGRAQEVVSELDALLADNPLRERLHAQRMLALYRSGRQAEALAAYREARQTLVEQIGVEPSPELRRLHDAILRQDPALDAAPPPAELPPQLDASAAPPLAGREAELRQLRGWTQGLATVAGGYGMGKTRLAAELAGEAHRAGATVVYASGNDPEEPVMAAIARAQDARGPVLLVVDDADRATPAARTALRDLRARVLATGETALAELEPRESLVLAPLDARAVEAIARFYAPPGVEPPVEELLAASRGVPGAVHEVAGEWARREATRRVDAAAGRAVAERSEARALDAELAGSVAELQAAREKTAPDLAHAPPVCPYKGLAAFDADDAAYFFGRERLVAELVAQLVGTPLLAVVGPSGSGKSSVVRAGLLPALAGGVLPGSARWPQAVMRPGARPLLALHRASRRLDGRGVLVVDQLEELFTTCADEHERGEFAAALAAAARERGGVVVVVRADFYGRCAAYPELAELLGANHVLVGPMARDELARAIERPAQRAGLSVEPELVSALLADVEGRPGALPLLSTALLELWRERDGRRLRLAAYVRSGGVQGAVARLAERAYRALDPERQAAARRLLLRLADEDDGGALVRRRVALSELDDAGVAAELADRRLLTVSDGAVEVAHEALLREWPRLRAWLDEDREGRRVHRRLGVAAREGGELYRGARLAAALEWAEGHAGELNAAERDFLDASRRAATRAQRRLRAVLAGVAALALLAVVAGVVALGQRRDARAQATAAAAQSLGAQALAEGDVARALLLARQGVALRDTPQTRSSLLAALLKSPAAVGVITAGGARVSALALSPDDRTLALAGDDGLLRFVDARTRREQGFPAAVPQLPPDPPDGVLAFSPDSALLAVGGTGPLIFDTRRHQVQFQFVIRPGQSVSHLAFLPAPRGGIGLVRTAHGTVVTRFVARENRGFNLPLGGPTDAAALLASRDGEVVTSRPGGPTVVRDPRTFRPLRQFPRGAAEAAVSPDGRTLLLGGADGSVRFLDLLTGRVRTGSARHDGPVLRATFSADGRTAATAGADNRAIAWDVARADPLETLTGHTGRITGLALTRDGATLYAGGLDGEVLVWDLAGARRLGRPFSTGGDTIAAALSSDGRLLAAGHRDGTVTVLDAAALRPLRTFRATAGVRSLAFVPGGPLAVGGDRGFVGLFDPRRGTRLQVLARRAGDVKRIVAGRGRMATLADRLEVWALRAGRVIGRPRTPATAHVPADVALSPDGRTLAVATATGVDLLDAATLGRRGTLADGARVTALGGFAGDGRSLAAGGSAGWARVWSAGRGRAETAELPGPRGVAPAASLSPDGRTLAAGSGDGTVRLFDVRTQQPLGAPLPATADRPAVPLFTPDGAHLIVIAGTGRAYRWDVRPADWARQACAIAGRRLTRAEWAAALSGRPYAPAC